MINYEEVERLTSACLEHAMLLTDDENVFVQGVAIILSEDPSKLRAQDAQRIVQVHRAAMARSFA